jgi:hypothetical protein
MKSIQQLLPVIAKAVQHVRTPEDFEELQHAVNSMATRWTLTSGGITGGDIGSKFNPLLTQALPMLEARGPAGPGEQSFDQWFKDYAMNRAASGAAYQGPDGSGLDIHPYGQVTPEYMGQGLAGVLGIQPGQLESLHALEAA